MELFEVLNNVSCGGGQVVIDAIIPGTIHIFVNILKIAIPIILIIFGMLDLAKAVMANDDKEMKEAQKKLIHRIVYAVVVFFVVALVQFVFGRLDSANGGNDTGAKGCINCFINNNCDPAD